MKLREGEELFGLLSGNTVENSFIGGVWNELISLNNYDTVFCISTWKTKGKHVVSMGGSSHVFISSSYNLLKGKIYI